MAEENSFGDGLSAAAIGAWGATLITNDAGIGYGFAFVIILVIAGLARERGIFEKLADRYGDRVREKLTAFYEKFAVFGKKLSDLLFHYGKYVMGAMFLGTIALIIVTPSLPFRGLSLAVMVFLTIDWYFNDLRTIRDVLFYWPYRPWRIFAVAAAVAVYIVATGQSEAALKLLIDILQRGVSQ